MIHISIRTRARTQMLNITSDVQHALDQTGVQSGVCYVFVPHTTAAVAINENADPSVARDIDAMLSQLVPESAGYTHLEGNSDSHIKAVMVGASEVVPVEDGRLQLGTWQGIYFCEFDGPRSRKVWVQAVGGQTR